MVKEIIFLRKGRKVFVWSFSYAVCFISLSVWQILFLKHFLCCIIVFVLDVFIYYCGCSPHVEVIRQLCEVESLFSFLHVLLSSNLGCQVCIANTFTC